MASHVTRIRGNLVTPDGIMERAILEIGGGVITRVGASGFTGEPTIDIGYGWVLPGFIDIHVHGGAGVDFMNATPEAFATITAFHARHGTTSMLATTVTAPKGAIEAVLLTAERYHEQNGARVLGVHVEGPFISPRWPGAQNPAYIVPPNALWMREWLERFPGVVKLVTLAPETEGALPLIEYLASSGVVCAAGHTDASYEQLIAAREHGLKHAVHLFNAMKGLHHRDPGAVGAVLTEPDISAEIIADGLHVHPAVIGMLARAKANGKLILITDAISAAGLDDGTFSLGGLDVEVQGGAARVKDGGQLAGSTLTMADAFRYMVRKVGLSIPDTSRLASENPAKLLGIDSWTGSVEEGKTADLVLLSRELQLISVWRNGFSIYNNA